MRPDGSTHRQLTKHHYPDPVSTSRFFFEYRTYGRTIAFSPATMTEIRRPRLALHTGSSDYAKQGEVRK